jgi:hypothetical protein
MQEVTDSKNKKRPKKTRSVQAVKPAAIVRKPRVPTHPVFWVLTGWLSGAEGVLLWQGQPLWAVVAALIVVIPLVAFRHDW